VAHATVPAPGPAAWSTDVKRVGVNNRKEPELVSEVNTEFEAGGGGVEDVAELEEGRARGVVTGRSVAGPVSDGDSVPRSQSLRIRKALVAQDRLECRTRLRFAGFCGRECVGEGGEMLSVSGEKRTITVIERFHVFGLHVGNSRAHRGNEEWL